MYPTDQRSRPRLSTGLTAGVSQPDAWAGCAESRAPFEARLHAVVAEHGGLLAAPLHRITSAAGKRLRPALVLTVAKLTSSPGSETGRVDPVALELAVAVELLHTATLIHDDLIDGAEFRRGVPTISGTEGSRSAVVAGDLLIGLASLLAAGVSAQAARLLSSTLLDLARGEAAQEAVRFDGTAEPAELLQITRLKTGSLLRAACLLGAEAAGLGEPATEALAAFGMDFGVSLQLVDDLLDVASTAVLTGKPVGADFLAGTPTMPAQRAMLAHPQLRALFRPELDGRGRRRAAALLRSREAIEPSLSDAISHAVRAEQGLRAVAGDIPGLHRLAGWPMRFLSAQVESKLDPGLRSLVQYPAATC